MRNPLSTKGAWSEWKVLPRALPFLRGYRKLMVLSALLTILVSLVALAEPWPLALMIDSVIGKQQLPGVLQWIFGSDPDRYLLLVGIVFLGFLQVVLGHGLTVVNDYVNAKMELNMVLDLRSKLFRHVESLSMTFHDARMTGQLMSQVNVQANALGECVMAFPPMAQSLFTLIGMLVIALLLDWQVTLIALVAIPFIYYAIGLYGTRIVPRIRQVQSLEWRSLSIVFEAMSMLRVIVPFGRERYEYRRFREQGQTAVDARVRLTVLQTMFSLGVSGATALGTALVLGFGALHVIQGKISVGQLYVLISYIASVYTPLEAISTTLGDLNQRFVYLNAALELLDNEPEVTEDPDAIDIGRSRGELTVENVSFAYMHRVDTLKNVSFEAKAGQRIAVVGPTGAGKTTLVSLIVRFYDPAEGRILIDGVDIRKLTLKSLRDQMSVVLQEPLLFSGTIAENIRYGRLDATMDEIIAAAKAANVHEFISRLPDGYQTEIGERGAQLSGGERQRICVARAFVRDAPILILDEPTSSIDSKTENVILDSLEQLMVGRTSIMIAHRLSTVRDADHILVLNDGEVVEQGTHEDLLSREGLYHQLYQAQTRWRGAVPVEDEAVQRQVIDSVTQAAAERAAAAADGNGGKGEAAPAAEPTAGSPEHTLPPPQANGERAPEREPERAPVNGAGAENGSGDELAAGDRAGPAEGDGVEERRLIGRLPRTRSRGFMAVMDRSLTMRGDVICDVCHRTLIKGEGVVTLLAPPKERRGGKEQRKLVCEVCWPAAKREGWEAVRAGGKYELFR
jgi:ATP-binding cassette subfamily B protein